MAGQESTPGSCSRDGVPAAESKDDGGKVEEREMKRRKLDFQSVPSIGGLIVRGTGEADAGDEAGGTEGGREGWKEDNDDDDDDLRRWQVPFLIGRLCARLGRHPRMVLENLSQALRLAKVRGKGKY